EADGKGGPGLGEAPELGVIERAMFDFINYTRPTPAGVDFVQQGAGRVAQPGRAGFLGLQIIAFETRPALNRVMMPGASGEVVVAMQIAMRQDVEARALLIAEDDGDGILEFLAETDVEHAGVQRAAPHGGIEPARARPGPGDGAGKDFVSGDGKHRSVFDYMARRYSWQAGKAARGT